MSTVAIEVGSTNVYADMGYPNPEEMQRKSSLARAISQGIKAKGLTQQQAAELLGIEQAKLSKITRGQFRDVSEATMLEFVSKLGRDSAVGAGKTVHRGGG